MIKIKQRLFAFSSMLISLSAMANGLNANTGSMERLAMNAAEYVQQNFVMALLVIAVIIAGVACAFGKADKIVFISMIAGAGIIYEGPSLVASVCRGIGI